MNSSVTLAVMAMLMAHTAQRCQPGAAGRQTPTCPRSDFSELSWHVFTCSFRSLPAPWPLPISCPYPAVKVTGEELGGAHSPSFLSQDMSPGSLARRRFAFSLSRVPSAAAIFVCFSLTLLASEGRGAPEMSCNRSSLGCGRYCHPASFEAACCQVL